MIGEVIHIWESIVQYLHEVDIFWPIIIFVVFLILAKIFQLIIYSTAKKLAKRTKGTLDDRIVNAMGRPIFVGILLLGIFIAVERASLLADYSDKISMAGVIVLVLWLAYFVSVMVMQISDWYMKEYTTRDEKGAKKYPGIFKKLTTLIIFAIALIIILKELNVEISPLVASLGIGGLAVALALKDTLENLFSGFYIFSDKTIKIGDYVELEGEDLKGYVEDIGWRTTRIRTLPGNMVIIPNAKLAQSITTNYYYPKQEMSVLVQVGVAYHTNLEKAEKIAIEVGKKIQMSVEGAKEDHVPFIRYHTFGDSNIGFTVILRTNEVVGQYLLKHEYVKALKKAFDKAKIEIAFPCRNVYMRK